MPKPEARSTIFGIVDWGSQSIAQSKFQRTAPNKGKSSKETFSFFSVNTFPNFCEKSFGKERRSFGPPSLLSLIFFNEDLAEGMANMQVVDLESRTFLRFVLNLP